MGHGGVARRHQPMHFGYLAVSLGAHILCQLKRRLHQHGVQAMHLHGLGGGPDAGEDIRAMLGLGIEASGPGKLPAICQGMKTGLQMGGTDIQSHAKAIASPQG
jgi:hypothetical protein